MINYNQRFLHTPSSLRLFYDCNFLLVHYGAKYRPRMKIPQHVFLSSVVLAALCVEALGAPSL